MRNFDIMVYLPCENRKRDEYNDWDCVGQGLTDIKQLLGENVQKNQFQFKPNVFWSNKRINTNCR